MSQPSPMTYRIERVATPAELDNLRASWQELLSAAGPQVPVFLTWEWVVAWCHHMEPSWESWILAAWDEQGKLAGVAPWMLSHHEYGLVRIKRLAFLGSNYAYRTHQDIVARTGEVEPVTDAFIGYLWNNQRSWDVLDLEGLAEGSSLNKSIRRARAQVVTKDTIECPYASLPGTWEAYELQQLSANRRQQIRARRRHLERDFPGQVVFQTVRSAEELPAAMDALVELHRKRWHGRGQASSFDEPAFLAFHHELASVALDCGWLRLYLLKIGDRTIATEYCFLYHGVLFDYQKAMDPDPVLDRYSPGQLVLAYALQEAIKEGAHEFDMARGNYDYKYSWTDQTRPDYHLILSATPVGHLWLYGGNLVGNAKVKSREILPDSVRRRLNQALSQRRREPTLR